MGGSKGRHEIWMNNLKMKMLLIKFEFSVNAVEDLCLVIFFSFKDAATFMDRPTLYSLVLTSSGKSLNSW